MPKSALIAFLTFSTAMTAPAFAQEAPAAPSASAPAATTPVDPAAPAEAAPAATAMTPEQIAAFNTAVTDFTAGQSAQQSGDNATAITKYEAAIPAIKTAVESDPSKMDNVNFLANALYANAAAYGAMGQLDKTIALYGESLPYWRKVVPASRPATPRFRPKPSKCPRRCWLTAASMRATSLRHRR